MADDDRSLRIAPDRALDVGAQDRLGFRNVAAKLAQPVLSIGASDGFVVAIEGAWGSGKTSFVGMLEDELLKHEHALGAVVRFEPWIVGDRDGMLAELISALTSAVQNIAVSEQSATEQIVDRANHVSHLLQGYAVRLGRKTAPIARLADLVGVPGAGLLGKLGDALSNAAEATKTQMSLSEIKADLIESLRRLPKRIVAIIDDLDRLDPAEAAEVVRLVKAVADFPRITYVLCYHREVLATNLATALSIEDGDSYLEKIVQVHFRVPQPEPFDLRRWLEEECINLHSTVTSGELSEQQRRRLDQNIGIEGQLLRTPREVVRIMNGLRLYWPQVADQTDFADMVWLQMVRLNDEKLFSWIEQYLGAYTEMCTGSVDVRSDREDLSRRLGDLVSSKIDMGPRSIFTLSQMLPGISKAAGYEEKDFKLFERIGEHGLVKFENDRRLGSPQHARFYFALQRSTGALDDSDVDQFLDAAAGQGNLADHCDQLIAQKRSEGSTVFDLLVDRLRRVREEKFSLVVARRTLEALSNCMDDAARTDRGVSRGLWGEAEGLFQRVLKRIPKDERRETIRAIFADGAAIGWLMCIVIGWELDRHGRGTSSSEPESQWIFSEDELDLATSSLTARLSGADRARIGEVPALLNFLYAWKKVDDGSPHAWVMEQCESDQGFLEFLEGCCSWVYSHAAQQVLKRSDLEEFVDFDALAPRLHEMASGAHPEKERMIRRLIDALELGA